MIDAGADAGRATGSSSYILQQQQQPRPSTSGVLCVVRSEELTEGYGIVTEVFVTWHITRVLYLTYFWKKRRF